jgi:hypothetical protein
VGRLQDNTIYMYFSCGPTYVRWSTKIVKQPHVYRGSNISEHQDKISYKYTTSCVIFRHLGPCNALKLRKLATSNNSVNYDDHFKNFLLHSFRPQILRLTGRPFSDWRATLACKLQQKRQRQVQKSAKWRYIIHQYFIWQFTIVQIKNKDKIIILLA